MSTRAKFPDAVPKGTRFGEYEVVAAAFDEGLAPRYSVRAPDGALAILYDLGWDYTLVEPREETCATLQKAVDSPHVEQLVPYEKDRFLAAHRPVRWSIFPVDVDPPITIRILLDVLEGIERLHATGRRHGALCPGAVVFDERGRAAITTPIARIVESPTSGVMARWDVMCAEEAEGGPPSPSWDIFAAAAIALRFFKRRPLHPNDTWLQLLESIRARPPLVPAGWKLGPAFSRALSPDPTARYESAAEFAEDLRRLSAVAAHSRVSYYAKLAGRAR